MTKAKKVNSIFSRPIQAARLVGQMFSDSAPLDGYEELGAFIRSFKTWGTFRKWFVEETGEEPEVFYRDRAFP